VAGVYVRDKKWSSGQVAGPCQIAKSTLLTVSGFGGWRVESFASGYAKLRDPILDKAKSPLKIQPLLSVLEFWQFGFRKL
jgi:hypothetical protein